MVIAHHALLDDFASGDADEQRRKRKVNAMSIQHQIRAFAGSFIIISLLLAHYHSPYWLWFTAFVGLNLFQSALTDFCPLEILLRRVEHLPKQHA